MFILDYLEKKLNNFSISKNLLFLTHCAHFWAKQNVSLNSCPISIFLKNYEQVSLCHILKEK